MNETIFSQLPAGVQAQLHTQKSLVSSATYSNGNLDKMSDASEFRQTITLLGEGRKSTSSGTRPDSEELLYEAALSLLPYGAPAEYSLPGSGSVPELGLLRTEALNLTEMVLLVQELHDRCRSAVEDVNVYVSLQRNQSEVILANSNGFSGAYALSAWHLSLMLTLTQSGDRLSFFDSLSSPAPDFDVDMLCSKLFEEVKLARREASLPAGNYPVIFAPRIVQRLLFAFVQALSGKSLLARTSPFKGRFGEKLFDSRFTLSDDGSHRGRLGSRPFDNQGVLTRRLPLIEAGVLKGRTLDLQAAAKLGEESTGHAVDEDYLPFYHLEMPAGTKSYKQLIAAMPRGLLITNCMGILDGDILSGAVNGIIMTGYVIENGEITGRIKNGLFNFNSFSHFRDHLLDFSSERQLYGASAAYSAFTTLPYVLLDNVTVNIK